MSDSSPIISERNSKYMVTDEKPEGDSKLFKLEKAGSDYNILALDNDGTNTVGYLYVSDKTKGVRKKSNRIMMSPASESHDTDAYKFSFIEHDVQRGVYKIKSKGLTLYGSVGGHNLKADNRGEREKSEEIWFQINLKAVN